MACYWTTEETLHNWYFLFVNLITYSTSRLQMKLCFLSKIKCINTKSHTKSLSFFSPETANKCNNLTFWRILCYIRFCLSRILDINILFHLCTDVIRTQYFQKLKMSAFFFIMFCLSPLSWHLNFMYLKKTSP